MSTRGECLAMQLLNEIVNGTDPKAVANATFRAKSLIFRLRRHPTHKPTGMGHLKMTPEQLRSIAAMHAETNLAQRQIAMKVGTTRDLVAHHLQPSPIMIETLVGKDP